MSYFNYKDINVYYRVIGDRKDSIIFVHGLGWSHEFFSRVLDYKRIVDRYKFIFVDLVGFGRSDKPDVFDYSMNSQTKMYLELLNFLGVQEISIISHSMGGVIAQKISEVLKTHAFINCEGALGIDDLRLSGYIYSQGMERFCERGFEGLKNMWVGTSYFLNLCATNSNVMFKSSQDLFRECTKENIMERFINNKAKKLYVYGEKNHGKRKSEEYFNGTNTDIAYIKNSGHSMVQDNPEEFYKTVERFLDL